MLDGLGAALNATGYTFVFGAWVGDHAEEHGVYMLADQAQLRADSDAGAEIILRGYVDLYTPDPTAIPKTAVENAMRDLGIWWNLESVQFEPEPGLIHYEWSFADTNGAASAEPEA